MTTHRLINLVFAARRSYVSAVLGVVILPVRPSVCLSVCHTRALWQSQTIYCEYVDTARKGNDSSFLTPTVVAGWRPIRLKFALKVTNPFEKCRLRQISAYNVSTVRDSENNSIMMNRKSTVGFPTSYRRSVYVTLSPQMVAQKTIFVILK